ncbi:amino acid/polyamine/organocation transporter (APC superfamily) [Motilibacter rhizosphaerae]|uniref:Amino acid/polyamine/organocation transporter (APC superfamily) n=1 Tax=Motilibacter rhizosphaerae TaxID=598652 RepID=A0A4Q7NUJ0_9ACTN|nr:amino acid permease [Motilibacter rhizosphaerae]RZS90863.1 amino acid/polyamine/organocation transporter (APC superfamily) [Motilibacter rhizosphaerae]
MTAVDATPQGGQGTHHSHAPHVPGLHLGSYRQELHRGVGTFASFAAGFSFVSILTTVDQFFFIGFGFGGAAFFWTWPVVFIGQLLVAYNFATLAARYPISGAIYQWSSRLAGPTFGWFTGWVMIVAQILTTAAAAIALQAILPQIWTGFQIVGGSGADSSPTSSSGAGNAVLLGIVLLAITTTVNALSVQLMSRINTAGVVLELVGVAVVLVMLFTHLKRGLGTVVHTTGTTTPAHANHVWAWAASGLMAAYVMVGFDSAGELSEETHAPRRTTPRTIVRSLTVSGVLGMLLLLGGILAAPSLTDGTLSSIGLPAVLDAVFGSVGGKIILADVAVAVFACTLAIQTAGSRMVYSMARERSLPFSGALSTVSSKNGAPVVSTLVVGVGAAIVLLVNVKQSAIFTALASLCIGMLYLAYLGVTVPLLLERIRHRRDGVVLDGVDEHGAPLFGLGRWGIPLNVLAVVFQVAMAVNLLWPRAAVYDLTGHTWWLRWSALLFVGLTLVAGVAIHKRNEQREGAKREMPFLPQSASEVLDLA